MKQKRSMLTKRSGITLFTVVMLIMAAVIVFYRNPLADPAEETIKKVIACVLIVLSAENKKQFFIPKNFAHGFVVLSDYAEFAYKCTDFYHPDDEGGLLWNDPEIGIEWPITEDMELTLSEKDTKWPGIASFGK